MQLGCRLSRLPEPAGYQDYGTPETRIQEFRLAGDPDYLHLNKSLDFSKFSSNLSPVSSDSGSISERIEFRSASIGQAEMTKMSTVRIDDAITLDSLSVNLPLLEL